ncbi:hypothetical protein CMUS01_03359 [Colletotrichum musicola]|uniref:Uncharacterized protein n=1 Tax=Colletotrichum musicola TaxID=2175873 RepID=A0A8H6NT97_9PEZI|nr:hypothetical protein CMUS01_03359 [Colletotrichum musicola]
MGKEGLWGLPQGSRGAKGEICGTQAREIEPTGVTLLAKREDRGRDEMSLVAAPRRERERGALPGCGSLDSPDTPGAGPRHNVPHGVTKVVSYM